LANAGDPAIGHLSDLAFADMFGLRAPKAPQGRAFLEKSY
jgi:hypothetical protein